MIQGFVVVVPVSDILHVWKYLFWVGSFQFKPTLECEFLKSDPIMPTTKNHVLAGGIAWISVLVYYGEYLNLTHKFFPPLFYFIFLLRSRGKLKFEVEVGVFWAIPDSAQGLFLALKNHSWQFSETIVDTMYWSWVSLCKARTLPTVLILFFFFYNTHSFLSCALPSFLKSYLKFLSMFHLKTLNYVYLFSTNKYHWNLYLMCGTIICITMWQKAKQDLWVSRDSVPDRLRYFNMVYFSFILKSGIEIYPVKPSLLSFTGISLKAALMSLCIDF